jgi:dihydrofolate reductase
MGRLVVFNHVSLDGYFVDAHGEMGFAHQDEGDAEWNAFVAGNASGGGTLLFGRVTYEMMASFWRTPLAAETMPAVAERMNAMPKVVFSRTLRQASWANTTLLTGDLVAEVRRMKGEDGAGMAILGSGSLVAQLTPHGLIDEYQIVVNPVVLGKGRTLFEGIEQVVHLRLTNTRAFRNGCVLLCYQPLA